MLIAKLKGSRVLARDMTDRSAEFICPECGERVTLVKGSIRVPHFRHLANSSCYFAQGETEEHMTAKEWLYNKMKKSCIEWVEIECRRFDGIRPDVAFKFVTFDFSVGVEFQRSDISLEEIRRRSQLYLEHGLGLLWCCTKSVADKIKESFCSGRDTIKLTQQMIEFYRLHSALYVFDGDKITGFLLQNCISPGRTFYNKYLDCEMTTEDTTLKTWFSIEGAIPCGFGMYNNEQFYDGMLTNDSTEAAMLPEYKTDFFRKYVEWGLSSCSDNEVLERVKHKFDDVYSSRIDSIIQKIKKEET